MSDQIMPGDWVTANWGTDIVGRKVLAVTNGKAAYMWRKENGDVGLATTGVRLLTRCDPPADTSWADDVAVAGPVVPDPAPREHQFERTRPSDGRWCVKCALPYSRWDGDPCGDPEPNLRRLDARISEMAGRVVPDGCVSVIMTERIVDAMRWADGDYSRHTRFMAQEWARHLVELNPEPEPEPEPEPIRRGSWVQPIADVRQPHRRLLVLAVVGSRVFCVQHDEDSPAEAMVWVGIAAELGHCDPPEDADEWTAAFGIEVER